MRASAPTVAVVAVAVVAVGAALFPFSRHLDIPPPAEVAQTPPTPTTTASVLVTANFAISGLEDTLNSRVPEDFSGTENDVTNLLSDDKATWTIHRERIEMRDSGSGHVAFSVRLVNGSANVTGKLLKPKGSIGKWVGKRIGYDGQSVSQTGHFAGTVSGTLTPLVTPDWTLNPQLTLDLKVTQAEMMLVGKLFKLSMRSFVEREVRGKANHLVTSLNDSLKNDPRLRKEIEKAWRQMFIVRRVAETPATWITLEPAALVAAQPRIANGQVGLTFGLTGRVAAYLQAHAPTLVTADLPPLQVVPASAPVRFSVLLPISTSLSELNAGAMSLMKMKGKDSIEIGDTAITIRGLRIAGLGDKVQLAADVTASRGFWFDRVSGTIYLTGRPVLDARNGRLCIDELEYDVATRNVLVKTANWFLQPLVLAELRKLAVIDLRPFEQQAMTNAAAEIQRARTQLPGGVAADLDLGTLRLDSLIVGREAVSVVLRAEGSAEIRVTSLEFVAPR